MKNGKKRVLVFLTFVCLMLGWGTSVTAEAAAIDDFSLDQYRADLYTDTDSMCNQSISYMLADKNPSDTMVALLDNKPTFQTGVTSWKAIHMVSDPTYIAQGMLDEKGYYEAIIFSVFVAQQSSTDYVYDICNQITSDANKIISLVDKWVTATDGMDGVSSAKKQKMSALSADTKSKLKDFIFGEYKKEHSGLESASDISDVISTVFDTADTLADAVMTLGSYMQLVEVSDNTKAVILEMYNKCPSSNALLKDALKEAAASMDNFGAAIVTTAYSVGQKELADIVCDMLDSGWQKVLSLNPYVKAFMTGAAIGDKIGTAISNTLFATDKTIEQYVKMKCLKEFHQVLCSVVKNMGTRYQASRTTENANNYIASISVLFTEKKLSCDFAINYADVLYSDASLGWMAISSSDYNEYVRCVTSIKQLYENYEEGLEIDYRCQLEVDYPELYEIYFGTDRGEEKIPVTGISFAQDEITVGVEDKECCIEGLVVSPQNATDQAVLYTSSDESVLSMWLTYSNVFIPHKTGTVTVTARSADGGYSDTITVHVVEGSTGNSAGAELPEITASGTCGEHLDWILFADGVLSITGTGEMEDYVDSYGYGYHRIPAPWDEYRAKLKQVQIQQGVTTVGAYAFYDCDHLMSVTLRKGLESIGECAFSGCNSLTSAVLPEGLKSIGFCVFNNCDSLTSVTLPEGLGSIGGEAFYSCDSLANVALPEGLKSIEFCAFNNCDSLASVTLPKGLENIGRGAFGDCDNLVSVTLLEGLESIEASAFSGCGSLTSVTLPKSLEKIGSYAFRYTRLKEVYYAGSKAEWDLIHIGDENEELLSARIYYCLIDCTHPRTTLTGRKAATCTAAGYTGDKVCDICHEVVEQGKSIPKTAHTYGKKSKVTKATTSKNGSIKGTCTVCGKTVSTKIYYAKTVSLSRTSYVYDGKAKKPSVTVRDSKGNKIAKSNYTVAYSANKNVGKGKVTVKFKGNYKGTLTKTFSIRPKATSVSKLTPKSKGFTVQWKKQSAQISGYELQYSTSSKFTRSTTKTQSIAKNKAAAKTISRLKAKKKYYVRVRTYKTVKVNGKSTKLYSDWSKVKTVTTKK